jgi:hypothetical protein
MADSAEPEMPQGRADSLKPAILSDAGTSTTPEVKGPMLEVHVPHETVRTWKAFFIQIATISVGLLIAIALEQSVETLHRAHERAALREDLHTESR